MNNQNNVVSLLSVSETDGIAKFLVSYINKYCPYIPDGMYFDFQNLLQSESLSIMNMPSGVKVKEYLDGKSYEGQYQFAILYKALPDSLNQRIDFVALLDTICEWLESIEYFDNEPEGISINYIRQLQSSYILNRAEDGYITYQAILTLNYEKWGIL